MNTQTTPQMPVTDWKKLKANRARIGWHVRLNNGQVGVITWIANGQVSIRVTIPPSI
jgi:hypothetical protein